MDAFGEVLGAVVDDGVGAEVAAERRLLLGTDGDDDLHAEEVRDLDRGGADPGSAAVDEEPLADADAAAADDVRVDGGEHLGQGRRGGEVVGVGHRQELGRGDGDLLGVTAAGEEGRHPVADVPPGHLGAEGGDRPGDLEPGDVGGAGRRVVEALALEEVGTIHPGGVDCDEDFVGRDLGSGHFGQLQGLGITRDGNRDGAHGTTLVRGADSDRGTCSESDERIVGGRLTSGRRRHPPPTADDDEP